MLHNGFAVALLVSDVDALNTSIDVVGIAPVGGNGAWSHDPFHETALSQPVAQQKKKQVTINNISVTVSTDKSTNKEKVPTTKIHFDIDDKYSAPEYAKDVVAAYGQDCLSLIDAGSKKCSVYSFVLPERLVVDKVNFFWHSRGGNHGFHISSYSNDPQYKSEALVIDESKLKAKLYIVEKPLPISKISIDYDAPKPDVSKNTNRELMNGGFRLQAWKHSKSIHFTKADVGYQRAFTDRNDTILNCFAKSRNEEKTYVDYKMFCPRYIPFVKDQEFDLFVTDEKKKKTFKGKVRDQKVEDNGIAFTIRTEKTKTKCVLQ